MSQGPVSPLEGATYLQRGEFDLVRLQPSPVDDQVAAFVSSFLDADDTTRAELRAGLSSDHFSTLFTFAKRRAVQALRLSDPAMAVEGLLGLAAIDVSRFDFRDLSWAIGLAQHVIWALGHDVDAALAQAAALACAETRSHFEARIGAPDEHRSLRAQGYRAIETAEGVGLIDDWGHRYEPTVDLAAVAFRIADVFGVDGYVTTAVTTGTEPPGDWVLRSGDAQQVRADVRAVKGCVSIHGELEPPARQMVLVWLVECDNGDVAGRLAAASAPDPGASRRVIAVTHGSLLCIVVGQASAHGVDSMETQDSMQRFVQPIGAALADAAG